MPTIANNQIEFRKRGITHNLQYQAATAWNISSNGMTTGSDIVDGSRGLTLWSIQDAVGATLQDNSVTNAYMGVEIWNVPTTATLLVQGGNLVGNTYGVRLPDDSSYGAAGAGKAVVSGVNVQGSTTAGIAVDSSVHGIALQLDVTGNSVASGSPAECLVLGSAASANIHDNTASITGNQIGVEVDTGKALIQNNDLTGNTVAGIWATNGATVDSGNCSGVNVTGLGVSAGGNNLSGYLAGTAKAIVNANAGGTPLVLADHDNFGAVSTNDVIADALTGQVDYSQTPAVIAAPANVLVTCVSEVPAAVTTLTDFISAGGYFSATGGVTVSSSDTTNYTSPSPYIGSGVITRTYIIADGCSVATSAVQTITFTTRFRRPSPVCR